MCDHAHLKQTLPFVEIVEAGQPADVSVGLARATDDGEDQRWALTVTGFGQFDGQNRTIEFVASGATAQEQRDDIARFVKLVLVEYAAATAIGSQLDLTFRRPGPAATSPRIDQRDPWHYWFFRLGASTYTDAEQSTSSRSYSFSASANRVTDRWKVRVSVSRGVDESSFTFDESETIRSRLTNWNVDTLVVKSVGPKWSMGLTSAATGSTFSNTRRLTRFMPGIEFDVFPYAESSRRSLTIQYTLGSAQYDYVQETIYGRTRELVTQHALTSSLGLRQPWGQAGASLNFTQQLSSPDRTRVTLNGNVSVRLLRSLTLNTSGSYARIRDLFTLARGTATDEEVLLRQRQLETGYRYSISIGLNYSFGALANSTVNPRFGG